MRSRAFGDKSKFFMDEGLARVSIFLAYGRRTSSIHSPIR
jgi:hypothetical protein